MTPERLANFLTELRENGGIIKRACAKFDISKENIYLHRKKHPDFASQWDEAQYDGIDVLEDTAKERGLATSDMLLINVIRAYRKKYTERHEVTGANGGPLQTTVQIYLPQNGRTNGKKSGGDK